jgi:hypothetical protein
MISVRRWLSLYSFMLLSVMTSMLCYYNNAWHEVYTEFNAEEEILIRVSTFSHDAFPVPKVGAETRRRVRTSLEVSVPYKFVSRVG